MPHLGTELPVTIHNWSDGRGKMINLCLKRDRWADRNSSDNVSVHCIISCDCEQQLRLPVGPVSESVRQDTTHNFVGSQEGTETEGEDTMIEQ